MQKDSGKMAPGVRLTAIGFVSWSFIPKFVFLTEGGSYVDDNKKSINCPIFKMGFFLLHNQIINQITTGEKLI